MGDTPSSALFSVLEQQAIYKVMAARRDMRHFISGSTVEEAVMQRLFDAAMQAPSVGLMQPWRFIRIKTPALRQRICELVAQERAATADALGDRKKEFLRLKVEGVRECAELVVVALAPDDGTLFGRRTLATETAIASVACSIQNMWLASRAENLGLGWVSLFDPVELAELLNMPSGSIPIAILCIGPVQAFYEKPMLEIENWRTGKLKQQLIFTDKWDEPSA